MYTKPHSTGIPRLLHSVAVTSVAKEGLSSLIISIVFTYCSKNSATSTQGFMCARLLPSSQTARASYIQHILHRRRSPEMATQDESESVFNSFSDEYDRLHQLYEDRQYQECESGSWDFGTRLQEEDAAGRYCRHWEG
jgi:hypothetical protein